MPRPKTKEITNEVNFREAFAKMAFRKTKVKKLIIGEFFPGQ
ncbi:hypothetical protein FGIG_09091 [Fasciola gigantica]|uniref:Uncharacterized protein n=1 Tax=Fasciola gigantica TaxID=46835 RepID=A0A504Z4Q3_FASGI|nr:hypothetical protein FGIG_09091 [Fasciola gigantica]